jgi:hypothetical protein
MVPKVVLLAAVALGVGSAVTVNLLRLCEQLTAEAEADGLH